MYLVRNGRCMGRVLPTPASQQIRSAAHMLLLRHPKSKFSHTCVVCEANILSLEGNGFHQRRGSKASILPTLHWRILAPNQVLSYSYVPSFAAHDCLVYILSTRSVCCIDSSTSHVLRIKSGNMNVSQRRTFFFVCRRDDVVEESSPERGGLHPQSL